MAQQRRIRWGLVGSVAAAVVSFPAIALVDSVGEPGIDARRLHEDPYNLTGEKISIGQVEIGRPPQFGLDKVAIAASAVQVNQVFTVDEPSAANDFVDGHATNVASVMISNDKFLTGVAPNARLYAAAVGFPEGNGQPLECLASQTVALQDGDQVRSINFSFGESLSVDPRENAMLDGDALLTRCIDWSSHVHDVLYVIAGNQGRGGIPIPTDLFNGITVANSTQIDGQFVRVHLTNLGSEPEFIAGRSPELESNVGARRSISLVAPGSFVEMFNPDDSTIVSLGTSFAAPHVTAAVALLQEFGDRQLRENADNWSLDSRDPQVSRVVLLNSADKLEDSGDGDYLGMTRTLLDVQGRTWLESDAYENPEIPLNAQLGTGHLNMYRAYQQFSAGQWNPNNPVPPMGWDYRTVSTEDTAPRYRDYVLEQPLQAGSFVSITLSWIRQVELQDENHNGIYDEGETFTTPSLNNLDVYLMPVDENDEEDSIWSSISEEDSIEHIFYEIPDTGRYKIRVVYEEQFHEPEQPYALAWWTVPAD